MPFSDGSSGVIERVLLPFDDLNLKEGTVGFLRTPEDVAVHLSVLSAQGPQGAKLLKANAYGALRASPSGFSHSLQTLVPTKAYAPNDIVVLPDLSDAYVVQFQLVSGAGVGANPSLAPALQISLDGGTTWTQVLGMAGLGPHADAFGTSYLSFNVAPLSRIVFTESGTTTSLVVTGYFDIIT